MSQKSVFTSPGVIIAATALTAGLGIFVYKKLSNKVKERKQEGAANQIDSKDPKRALSSTLAQRCYTAFYPSGYPGAWDGTDEDALYSVAKEMFKNKIPFAYLTEAYRKLYSRQFAQDLADELSSDELTKFYNNLQRGLGNVLKQKGVVRQLRTANRSLNQSINLI